jgi:2-polyprenyl-6-methoxyphenol hydroxylase-like FAD-dependent oxidoreductase
MYDVIVVGSRVAGASTAMLLAGKGLRVLVVDQAAFPSDTLSTHQMQLPGGARLRRWGLLGQVVASGAPPARQVSFDAGPVVLRGRHPAFEGVDAVYSPRRTVLDALLLEAARAAGADVRERFVVEELTGTDGRVTGIRGRHKGGRPVAERARLVVGADGKHSLVARTVGAAVHHDRPPLTMACYTYWQDVSLEGGELYARPRRAVGAWPTNDGLTMTYVGWPVEEFPAFRADVEGNVLRTLDLAGDLGERVRDGRRAERFRASPDLPNFLRRPYGPGWALVGTPAWSWTRSPARGSATPCATPSCWPRRSPPASAAAGRWPPPWPATSGPATGRPCRCTSSQESWPASPRPGPSSRPCSPPWPAARTRSTGSWPCSPAR